MTVTGVGNVVVEASQAGNATYAAATPVDKSFTVSPALLTITANNDSKTYGTLKTFSSTAFTESGLVNGDSITNVNEASTGAPAVATVGTYLLSFPMRRRAQGWATTPSATSTAR